ncbi:MAG: hypothetical protein V3U11_14140, partial [Planctomycetota bacterium]
MKITLLSGAPLLLVLYTACASPGNSPEAPAEPGQKAASLEEARRLYQQDKLDEALVATDALLEKDPRLREAWLLAADANLALWRQRRRDRGPVVQRGQQPTEIFIQDAIRNLRRALRGDEKDADIYLKLSGAYLLLGIHGTPNWTAGRNTALQAAALYDKNHGGSEKIGEAVLMAAKHELR